MRAASPPRTVSSPRDVRLGLAAAAAAAIIYGIAYPATAIALRSFTPLAVAGIACTIALPLVIGLAAIGLLPRPNLTDLRGPQTRPARRPGGSRRHPVHRRDQRRHRPERLDHHRVRGPAVCRRGGRPGRAHPGRAPALDVDRRLRPGHRRDGPAGRRRAGHGGVGGCRRGRGRRRPVRAVHRAGPPLGGPLSTRWHPRHHRQSRRSRADPPARRGPPAHPARCGPRPASSLPRSSPSSSSPSARVRRRTCC